MITTITGRTFASLLCLAGLITALTGRSAFSAQTDCLEDAADGRQVCTSHYPKPMEVSLCDEFPATNSNLRAWCLAGAEPPSTR